MKDELQVAIDEYVISCGGVVVVMPDTEAKKKLAVAIANFCTECQAEGHDDGEDDGYRIGSADAAQAKKDAEEANRLAAVDRDTLARVMDALGWDHVDRDRFDRLGVMPRNVVR